MESAQTLGGERAWGRGGVYLFAVSWIMMFLELLLIRWIGMELQIFAYFRNLTLISCFLGLGLGFSLKKYQLTPFVSLLLVLTLAVIAHPAAEIGGVSFRLIPQYLVFPEYYFWEAPDETTVLRMVLGFAMIAVVVSVLAIIFIPFGQVLARIFSGAPNRLRAYSINLLGSLLGIWAFTLISFLNTPPWLWFALGGTALLVLIPLRSWKMAVSAAAVVLISLLAYVPQYPPAQTTYWSPYQKLELRRLLFQSADRDEIQYYQVLINSLYYMSAVDLSPAQMEKHPKIFNPAEVPYYPYNLPFRFKPQPGRVLIVGSGAGNDSAAALRNGAGQVDAVEIDPMIARIGRQYHPEHPYSDPRLRLIVDDARSYFKKTRQQYDFIIFALLDSHTLTSNFTNINLDAYVYTRESLMEAKGLLAPGGVVALNFLVARPWLGCKLYALVTEVFGEPPLVLENNVEYEVLGGVGPISDPNDVAPGRRTGRFLFLCGDLKGVTARLKDHPELVRVIAPMLVPPANFEVLKAGRDFDAPTDDWPYLYLAKRQIPLLYIVMIAVLLSMTVLAVRFLLPRGGTGPSHFLFLGAGFMLIEVHSISKTSLLFGSTWIVNVAIISAVLCMGLAANLAVLRWDVRRPRFWYGGVFLSLLLTYLVPVHSLLFGGYLVRGLVAGTFYCLPLFFSGVVFASSLRRVRSIESAFAANMIGAMLGGILETASFLFGLKAVVLIALVLYAASALVLARMPILKTDGPGVRS